MSRIRTLTVAATMCVAAMLTPAVRAQVPEVVRHIPDDAVVFIAVPSLQSISDKTAMLNERLGIGRPEMANLLGMVKAMSGLNQGLRDSGGAAFAITSVPNMQGGEPDMVVLVPISDYDQVLANFAVTDADPDTATQIEFQGEAVFVKRAGDFAVAAPTAEICNKFQAPAASTIGQRVGRFGAGVFSSSDVIVYINVERLAPLAQGMLAMGLMQAQMALSDPAMAEVNPMGAEVAGPMLQVYGEVLQAFFRDGQAAVIGLDVNADGFGLTSAIQFREGSPLATVMANPAPASLGFDRLPNRPYIAAASMNLSGLPIAQWVERLKAAFPADSAFGKIFGDAYGTLATADGETQTAAYPAEGQMPFAAVTVTQTSDPAAYHTASASMIRGLDGVELAPNMAYRASVTDGATEVAGHKVDQYTIGMAVPPELAAQLGPMAMFMNQQGYMTHTDTAYVQYSGMDMALLEAALNTADGGGTLGRDTAMRAVQNKLLTSRLVEGYVSLGGIVAAVKPLGAMFFPGVDLTVPANLRPVAFSASAAGGGGGERLFVPMDTVEAAIGLVQRFQQQMPN